MMSRIFGEWMAFLFARFGKKQANKSIILGTDYAEYSLCKAIQKNGDRVSFFISDDPWKYDTSIEGAICRYPSELYALCERYQIDTVYYCDDFWLSKINNLPAPTALRPGVLPD